MLPLERAIARAVSPLDRVRGAWLRALGGWAKPLMRDRELRVGLAGALAVLSALLTSGLLPLWTLALGPILLGVPHIVSDVRYLVAKPGYHKRVAWCVVVGLPLIAVTASDSMAMGLLASLGAVAVARADLRRKLAAAFIIVGLMRLSAFAGHYADLGFVYAHNLIAVWLWWAWRPRKTRWHWLPLSMIGVGCAALLGGVFDPWLSGGALSWSPQGLELPYHLSLLAPEVAHPWGMRLVLLFSFLQSVHYGIWLRLMPEEDRGRDTPRTFAASALALRADLGRPLLWVSVLAAVGVACWATFALAEAREGYLRMALFHGYLELAVVTMFWLEGRPRGRS
jgi:hypothetical protein